MALKGELHPQHKLTENQVRMIRKLWDIGHRNIKVLVKNKTWTHILFGEFGRYE